MNRARIKNKIVPTRTVAISCDPVRLLTTAAEMAKDGKTEGALNFARLASGILQRQVERKVQAELDRCDAINLATKEPAHV